MLSDRPNDLSMKSQLDVYVRILSKLSPSIRLRTLVLTLHAPDRRPPLKDKDLGDVADWAALDELLAQGHFSSLQIVKVNFLTGDYEVQYEFGDEFVSLFERRLPMLYERHILQSWNDWRADWKHGELSKKRYQWYFYVDCHLVIRASMWN